MKTYYKPISNVASDYQQGELLFIHRNNLSLKIYAAKEVSSIRITSVGKDVLSDIAINEIKLEDTSSKKVFLPIKNNIRYFDDRGIWGHGDKIEHYTELTLRFSEESNEGEFLILKLPLNQYNINEVILQKVTRPRSVCC